MKLLLYTYYAFRLTGCMTTFQSRGRTGKRWEGEEGCGGQVGKAIIRQRQV